MEDAGAHPSSANKLRAIQYHTEIEQARREVCELYRKATVIPSTPEQSAELRGLDERQYVSRKEIEPYSKRFEKNMESGMSMDEAFEKAEAEEAEQSYKAGDFNGDHAPDGYFSGHPIGEYREHAYDDSDINETTDDEYMRHAAVSDAKALADYQRRVRNLGWVMAAIALGAIIAIVEIVATICG